jgi:hypothetical protein
MEVIFASSGRAQGGVALRRVEDYQRSSGCRVHELRAVFSSGLGALNACFLADGCLRAVAMSTARQDLRQSRKDLSAGKKPAISPILDMSLGYDFRRCKRARWSRTD